MKRRSFLKFKNGTEIECVGVQDDKFQSWQGAMFWRDETFDEYMEMELAEFSEVIKKEVSNN